MRALLVEPVGDRATVTMSRALAAAGWTVGVATTPHWGLADASKSVARRHRIPAPERDIDGFAAGVAAAVRDNDYQLVLPGAGDAVLMALSLRRDEIPALFPYPEHSCIVRALDKLSLTEAGRRAGLEVPRTALADEADPSAVPLPAVVKQRLHADFASAPTHARIEARVVSSRGEAENQAAAIRAAGGVPLMQEMVSGQLRSLALVADREGRIVASMQQASERTWPPVAGVSARARTVKVEPALEDRVGALLRDLGWFGLAQLQFVVPDSAEPRLIDFNGRPYGSLALAVAAGVNLPAVWAAIATGEQPPVTDGPVAGIRYQWIEGDLRSALAQGSGRIRGLRGCVRYSRGAVHSVWARRDPRPSARYLRLRVAGALSGALRGKDPA